MSRLPACPNYFVFLLTNLIFIPSYLTASLFRCIHIANNPIKRPLYSFFYSGRPTWKVKSETWKVKSEKWSPYVKSEKWVLVGFPEISMKVCKNASMQVFWVQTFLTKILPGPNFFKPSEPGGLRIFWAFASLFGCMVTPKNSVLAMWLNW